jgi:excisionase family DNA binding protein
VAKLDKAPVSKTGDSRFESWLARLFLSAVLGSTQGNTRAFGPRYFAAHTFAGTGPSRLAFSKVEAAEALGVSVDFLEEHVMHELRVVRKGRRRLIPVKELVRWLDEQATRALD